MVPIITLSDPDIISKLETFIHQYSHGYYNYCIVTDDNIIHKRLRQPCWGELRTHYKDISKPSDLRDPFPKGNPIGLGISSLGGYNQDKLRFILTDPDSPWVNAFSTIQIIEKNDQIIGFILPSTYIDPTLFISGLLNIKGDHDPSQYLNMGIPWKIAYWLSCSLYNGFKYFPYDTPSYYFPKKVDFKLYLNNQPKNLSIPSKEGNLFINRAAYNRVNITEIWDSPDAMTFKALFKEKYPELTKDILVNEIVPQIQERGII